MRKLLGSGILAIFSLANFINPQIAYATQLQKTFVFESSQPIQSQAVNISDLAKIDSVSVDNGTVSYSTNGSSLNFNLSGGAITNSKYVSGQPSAYYNDGTYSGTLSSYLASGSYTPADTKSVSVTGNSYTSSSSVPSTYYYNSGGYSGTLTNNYTNSYTTGSYTPGDSKYVSGIAGNMYSYNWSVPSTYYYNDGTYSGTLSRDYTNSYVVSETYTPADSKTISVSGTGIYWSIGIKTGNPSNYTETGYSRTNTMYYNSNGYSGTLTGIVEMSYSTLLNAINAIDAMIANEPIGYQYYYQGSAPCTYTGTVTRPASDIKVYNYYGVYSGTVTKPAVNTLQTWYYGNYSGNVTKPAVDTRVYEYEGNVYTGGTPLYKYTVTVTYENDITPPVLSLSENTTAWTNQTVSINASATDDRTGVKDITLPSGSVVYSSSASYPVSSNGTYTFKAEDNSNNVATNSITINNIDNTPPTSPTVSVNTAWTNASSVPVSITSGTDGQSGVSHTEYSLSGATTQGWATYSSSFNVTNEGQTTISTRTVDNAGNYSPIVSQIVKIDRQNPDATITPNPYDLTNSIVTLSVNATDNLSGVKRIQLPDGNWISGNTAQYALSDNQTVTFNIEDNAGNVGTKQYSVANIKKDVLVTNNPNVTLQLSAQDTLSGVAKMQFRNEYQSWSAWEAYSTTKDWFLDPVDGLKHVWVQYMDMAGNISSPAEDIIILDQTAPIISTFQINNGDANTGNPNVTLSLSATDNLTGVKSLMISNDNVNWTTVPYVTSTPWTLANGDGNKTVYVKVVDGAGNISSVISDTIYLDMTKPVAGILINNGQAYTDSPNVNLTLTFSDSGSGVSSVKVIEGTHEYTLPSNATSPTILPWTLDYGAVRTVTIVVTDKVGNVTTASATINVDKLTIKNFTLTNVVNPSQTFTPVVWPFQPQTMLSGANISFTLNLKTPYDASVVTDNVQYKVEIIGSGGYDKAIVGSMDDSGGDVFTKTVTIPQDAPNGAKVYVSATAQRKLLVSPYDVQTVYFPNSDDSTIQALIGTIGGNINQTIIFNETI